MVGLYVTVCAWTHQRPEGLRALLAGLAAQHFEAIAPPRIEVVSADNEGSAGARAICAQVVYHSALWAADISYHRFTGFRQWPATSPAVKVIF